MEGGAALHSEQLPENQSPTVLVQYSRPMKLLREEPQVMRKHKPLQQVFLFLG